MYPLQLYERIHITFRFWNNRKMHLDGSGTQNLISDILNTNSIPYIARHHPILLYKFRHHQHFFHFFFLYQPANQFYINPLGFSSTLFSFLLFFFFFCLSSLLLQKYISSCNTYVCKKKNEKKKSKKEICKKERNRPFSAGNWKFFIYFAYIYSLIHTHTHPLCRYEEKKKVKKMYILSTHIHTHTYARSFIWKTEMLEFTYRCGWNVPFMYIWNG